MFTQGALIHSFGLLMMMLGVTSRLVAPIAFAPPAVTFAPTLLFAETLPQVLPNGGVGAQPTDLIYVVGVLGVLLLGGLQIFDSTFAENTQSFVPPMPGSASGLRGLPVIGPALSRVFGAPDDPEAACEALRQRLQAAAEAGDLETAFRLEKELKQMLADTGVRYVVEDKSGSDSLPENW